MARRGNPACRGRRARLGGKDNGASQAECARGDYGDDYADTSLNPSPLTYGEAERQAFLLLINELAGAGGFEAGPGSALKVLQNNKKTPATRSGVALWCGAWQSQKVASPPIRQGRKRGLKRITWLQAA